MGQIEDEGIEPEVDNAEDIDAGDGGGGAPRERGDRPIFRDQAIRALQRARKSVGNDDEASPMTGYLMQAATVWAILELADAVREGRES